MKPLLNVSYYTMPNLNNNEMWRGSILHVFSALRLAVGSLRSVAKLLSVRGL